MSQLIIESTISIVIGLYCMIDSIKSFKKYSNSENPITRVNNVLQPIFSLFQGTRSDWSLRRLFERSEFRSRRT